jgi:hypothetical protein
VPLDKKASKPSPTLRATVEQELAEVPNAWQKYRSTNDRDAVYFFLEAVFVLVMRWQSLGCSLKNSRAALRFQANAPQMKPEPFADLLHVRSRGGGSQDPQQMVSRAAVCDSDKACGSAPGRFYQIEWRVERMCSTVRSEKGDRLLSRKWNSLSGIEMLLSAEVRWFWRGRCPQPVHDWFFKSGLPPGGGRSRIDRYVSQRSEPEISLKKRRDKPGFEVKGLVTTRNSPELEPLTPHIGVWCKWSCTIPRQIMVSVRASFRH